MKSSSTATWGKTPLRFDLSGLAASNLPLDTVAAEKAWGQLSERFRSGEIAFYDSVVDPSLSQVDACVALADELLKGNSPKNQFKFKDVLFLGIGGSALGPLSLLNALPERMAKNAPRIHILENPDPLEWRSTLQALTPETTLVVCVTKSGTTFETLAQFLLALEWLTPSRWSSHCVAITDPVKGDLRRFATEQNIPTLAIHPAIGGRYSVFTPVGIFAARLAGLDPHALLLGAAQVREEMQQSPPAANPLFALASKFVAQEKSITTHVCMPYSTRLRTWGNWFVQLWGESLGKDQRGFTPIAALGAVDQHSILQLLRDGPRDKATFFVTVDQVTNPVPIPAAPNGKNEPFSAFEILAGSSLHALLAIEQKAIARVLQNQKRPYFEISLETLDERAMGALYFSFCVLTALTGTLMGVEPFDQPGVEEGKIYIRESLLRK